MLHCIWSMKKRSHWKLLADLNISLKTVDFLRSEDIDVRRIEKSVSTDEGVVETAVRENRIILTFDKDFGEIYYFHLKKTFAVIVLSLENQTSGAVNDVLRKFFSELSPGEIENKLIILYERRYRI